MVEVRKKGKVLEDDEGSFYQSLSFRWRYYLRDFIACYCRICDAKQVEPVYPDAKLKAALKVPFASLETLRLLQDCVVQRFLQFRARRIRPFSKLPEYPTRKNIDAALEESRDEKDIHTFLAYCHYLPLDLENYLGSLEKLSEAYKLRIDAYKEAVGPSGSAEKAKAGLNKSRQTIQQQLAPYIKHLKSIGYLPAGWVYPFKEIPLLEAECTADFDSITEYWKTDTLPPVQNYLSKLFTAAKKESERKVLEVEERPKPKPAAKPAPKKKKPKAPKYYTYRESLWTRFDEWVTDIGDWFDDCMDEISDWLMTASLWLVFISAAGLIIAEWIAEGFLAALMAGFLLMVVLGLLSAVLEVLGGLLAIVVKYLSYVPLFILRCIFYRGWTFLLFLLALGGFVTYFVVWG